MVKNWVAGLGAEQRHVKATVIGLLVEWTLHQGVGNHADNCPPRTAVAPGLKIRTRRPIGLSLPKYLSRETGINNRHRLFVIVVVNGEVAAFQNLKTERRKVVIRDGFEVAPRAIPVRHIILTINFIFDLGPQRSVGNGRSSPRFEARDWRAKRATRE